MSGITIAGVPIEDTTIAGFLSDLANALHPRVEFTELCTKHDLTTNVGRILANRGGFPDKRRLQRASEEAANRAQLHRDLPPTFADKPVEKPAEVAKTVLITVPVTSLQGDPDNLREHLNGIDELAESIKSVGLLEPIVVRRRAGGALSIVAGHRRRAALLKLGVAETDVLLNPIPADDVLLAMLIENGQREDLDPIAEARGIAKLKAQFGLTDGGAGTKLGRSQAWVSNRLALLNLSPEDQAAIRAGTMSLGRGTQAGRHNGGTNKPGMVGKASAAHLAFNHPLASAAETVCRQLGHHKNKPGRVGNIACGECWEAVIRSDERNRLARGRQAATDLRDGVVQLRDDWSNAGRAEDATELDQLLEGAS